MWSKKEETSYSLEEFQMFIEYCNEYEVECSIKELETFLRLLRAIKE